MGVKAYVLINTETAHTPDVVRAIRKAPGVIAVNEVMGPYDMVVELEVERFEDISKVLREHIRSVSGVRNTMTCAVLH